MFVFFFAHKNIHFQSSLILYTYVIHTELVEYDETLEFFKIIQNYDKPFQNYNRFYAKL